MSAELTTTTNENTVPTASSSSSSSPAFQGKPSEALPTNISTQEQLDTVVPEEFQTGDSERPLCHTIPAPLYEDSDEKTYNYSLNPMTYSVPYILSIEFLERFSFYGVYYTLIGFLTGVYNEDWNPGLSGVDAASCVSISTAVAYTTPFLGAYLADVVLGEYWTILAGGTMLYIPGLLLICLSTVPGLLGETFNRNILALALLVLWPMGTSFVKSCVNIFGAKQFHPLLQSTNIERYYVNFYMCINVGSLLGILIIPVVSHSKGLLVAYNIPIVLVSLGMTNFMLGTPRYSQTPLNGSLRDHLRSFWNHMTNPKKRAPRDQYKTKSGVVIQKKKNKDLIPLTTIFRIGVLIVPFCIAYSQMPTTFIVQGTVMKPALFGILDAATMNMLDCFSVLTFGFITGNYIYPKLANMGYTIPTTYKFALGSFLGALAISWSLFVEHRIHIVFESTGEAISVLWQAPSYILIGWGEIYAISAAYEAAFSVSSPQQKVMASAVNLFAVGGIPNFACIFLQQACQSWFKNTTRGDGNIQHLKDYATASVYKYFEVLLFILVIGICLNIYPPIRDFVESIEDMAAEMIKTPIPTRPASANLRRAGEDEEAGAAGERTPLLTSVGGISAKKPYNVEELEAPVLYKLGTMRAGALQPSERENRKKKLKRFDIGGIPMFMKKKQGGGK